MAGASTAVFTGALVIGALTVKVGVILCCLGAAFYSLRQLHDAGAGRGSHSGWFRHPAYIANNIAAPPSRRPTAKERDLCRELARTEVWWCLGGPVAALLTIFVPEPFGPILGFGWLLADAVTLPRRAQIKQRSGLDRLVRADTMVGRNMSAAAVNTLLGKKGHPGPSLALVLVLVFGASSLVSSVGAGPRWPCQIATAHMEFCSGDSKAAPSDNPTTKPTPTPVVTAGSTSPPVPSNSAAAPSRAVSSAPIVAPSSQAPSPTQSAATPGAPQCGADLNAYVRLHTGVGQATGDNIFGSYSKWGARVLNCANYPKQMRDLPGHFVVPAQDAVIVADETYGATLFDADFRSHIEPLLAQLRRVDERFGFGDGNAQIVLTTAGPCRLWELEFRADATVVALNEEMTSAALKIAAGTGGFPEVTRNTTSPDGTVQYTVRVLRGAPGGGVVPIAQITVTDSLATHTATVPGYATATASDNCDVNQMQTLEQNGDKVDDAARVPSATLPPAEPTGQPTPPGS